MVQCIYHFLLYKYILKFVFGNLQFDEHLDNITIIKLRIDKLLTIIYIHSKSDLVTTNHHLRMKNMEKTRNSLKWCGN